MDDVLVAGIDGQKEAYAEILKGGQYKSTVINNSWEITQKAVNLLMDYLQTKIPPKEKERHHRHHPGHRRQREEVLRPERGVLDLAAIHGASPACRRGTLLSSLS